MDFPEGSIVVFGIALRGDNGKTSTASITGLGTAALVLVDAKKEPSDASTSSVCSGGSSALTTGRNDSAYHSYQTFRSLVNRQIDTCTWELLGKYNGS